MVFGFLHKDKKLPLHYELGIRYFCASQTINLNHPDEMHPIDIAVGIASRAHAGTLDKDGYPYILHPLTVGVMGNTDDEKIAGFLHDVVEDTDWTFDDLLREGIPASVVNALKLLTRDYSMTYDEYLQRIIDSGNPISIMVKYHDLQHNFARGKAHPELQKKHGAGLAKIRAAIEKISKVELYAQPDGCETAIFACGCFWGVQYQFSRVPGVTRVLAGYTGDDDAVPSYEDVRSHKTRHIEAVAVEYDPSVTDYETLCKLFYEIHDPAQTDGVGPDIGPQYRSCIFYSDDEQKRTAESLADILRGKGYEVNTLMMPASRFYIAEKYHQDYYEHTGGSPYCHLREKKF